MGSLKRILSTLSAALKDRDGVTAAEYAILEVGIVIVVGAALMAFDLANPMNYAASTLLSEQSALGASPR
jgi:Flp pilus assembly pilin Flp